jgi:hypothetical protein
MTTELVSISEWERLATKLNKIYNQSICIEMKSWKMDHLKTSHSSFFLYGPTISHVDFDNLHDMLSFIEWLLKGDPS